LTQLYQQQQLEAEKAIRTKAYEEEQEMIATANAEREANKQAQDEKDLATIEANNQLKKEAEEKALKEAADAPQQMLDARQCAFKSFMSAFDALAKMLEDQGVKTAGLQKALALVQLAVDTAKAISSVIAGASAAAAAGGPAAPFLIGGYIASGIATVITAFGTAKKILASAPSIGGSGGGGSSVNPSFSAQGGSFQPSNNVNVFNGGGNNDFGNSQGNGMTISTVVVASEIEAKNRESQDFLVMGTL